jgi:uracil phosphoribosyltransferase
MSGSILKEKIGLVPILRAGLGMVEGVWELMPSSEVWHIGIYRDEKTLKPVDTITIAHRAARIRVPDPGSHAGYGWFCHCHHRRAQRWGVKRIKFVGIIGAPEGIKAVHDEHPDVPVFLADVDRQLNEHGYILPGLGDAGDRQFGTG